MNERIRKLAQQSMWSKTDYSQENEMYSFSRDELEKFAELIVRECADVSWRHWLQFKDCSAHFSIREHFGVEGVEE